jgi:methyl-accepting chemotaxis protein
MRALDDLPLKLKVALLAAVCLLLMAFSSGLTLWGTARLGAALQSLYSHRLPTYAFAARLETDLRDLNGLVYQSLALEAAGFSPDEIGPVDRQITLVGERVQKMLDERIATADAQEQEQLRVIAKSYGTYRKALLDALDLRSSIGTAATFLTTAMAQYEVLRKAVTAISASELRRAGEEVAQAQASSERVQELTVGAGAAALVLAGLASFAITRGMLQRVRHLSRSMAALGDGDLTHPIPQEGRDEIGRLMRDAEAVRERFSESLREVRLASDSVRTAAGEIAAGNASLGQRTESASSALQQTTASMHQLTGAVDENARASERASDTATGAADAARASGEMVVKVVQTMGEINDASRRIAEITSVIDGIAFQTNILALNAAVEAARAGEHGRGFAVVAAEVRNLAQRAAGAAKEIAGLVQASVSSARAGNDMVSRAGGSIEHLVKEVSAVADHVTGIRTASLQQSAEIRQVNAALTSIDTSTQQNAALVEESTAAAHSLREQADNLAQALARFRLDLAAGGQFLRLAEN